MFVNLRIEKFLGLHKRLNRGLACEGVLNTAFVKSQQSPFVITACESASDPVPAVHAIVKSRYPETISFAHYLKGVGSQMSNYLVLEWSDDNWYGRSDFVNNAICAREGTEVFVRNARKVRSWVSALRQEWVRRFPERTWPSMKQKHLSGKANLVRQSLFIELDSMVDCITDIAEACDPYLSEGDYEATVALLASKTVFGGLFFAHEKIFGYSRLGPLHLIDEPKNLL